MQQNNNNSKKDNINQDGSDVNAAIVHIVNLHYADIIKHSHKETHDALYESREVILNYLDDREEKAAILENLRKKGMTDESD